MKEMGGKLIFGKYYTSSREKENISSEGKWHNMLLSFLGLYMNIFLHETNLNHQLSMNQVILSRKKLSRIALSKYPTFKNDCSNRKSNFKSSFESFKSGKQYIHYGKFSCTVHYARGNEE